MGESHFAGVDSFTPGVEGYIAFELNPGSTPAQYGWLRVTLNDDGTGGLIHDYVLSTEEGDIVTVGVIPEPGSLLLCAAGALAFLRRRR